MLVVAIDTGRGIGFSQYDTAAGTFGSWEASQVSTTDMAAADVIVVERYEQRSNVTAQDDALKQNGVIERFCAEIGIEFVQQMPADAKRFSKDDKLKALGWYVKTKDMHATDSARHLLRYLVKNKLLRADDMKKLAGVLR